MRQNELRKEIESKNLMINDEEERQARQLVEKEKMFLEETNGRKLFELQTEKDDLQRAIDFQKYEQERIRSLSHQKDFEFELMKL